jgi:transcriptional regulator
VGIRLPIARLEGKVKMSQNRPAADQSGVIEGLRHDGQKDLAEAIAIAVGG